MIVSEKMTIQGRKYVHTYSDSGKKIERDGVTYDDAIDPQGSDRVYIETDTPISPESEDATTEDFEEALGMLGVIE